MKFEESKELELFLLEQGATYGRPFTNREVESFCRYYELVLQWNPLLHLTTIISPQEFAQYHILESAFVLQFLEPSLQNLWDIGSGMGAPGIPLAILRPDLAINLVEANYKKSIFLKEVKDALNLSNLRIHNTRFETLKNLGIESGLITRALDHLRKVLSNLLNLGRSSAQTLILGNTELVELIQVFKSPAQQLSVFSIPRTNNRLLICISRFT